MILTVDVVPCSPIGDTICKKLWIYFWTRVTVMHLSVFLKKIIGKVQTLSIT